MKIYFPIILFFLLSNCSLQKQHADEVKIVNQDSAARKFFEDSVAGLDIFEYPEEKFTRFLSRFYPNLKAKKPTSIIYAFEEPFVDTTYINPSTKWFRITVDPCFRLPYCFVLEKVNDKSTMTLKITNGFGCQYPGILSSTTKFVNAKNLYDSVSLRLKEANFWNLSYKDTVCRGGLDGETWTIEAIEKGRYNIISRWCPQTCGDSTSLMIGKIGKLLGKQSNIDGILQALGASKSGL
jgi:hypothetical protein